MNKKEKFLHILANEIIESYFPFQPILMHFAERLNGRTYGEFASDHRVQVESNIRALEEFDLDWVELISDPYRETSAFGAKVKMHICGDINHLLPSLKDLNLDILDLDSQVDLDYARNIVGPSVALCGNINPVIIQNSGIEQISRITTTLIESQRGKKFILSGGCEITVSTPHENLKAMRKISTI